DLLELSLGKDIEGDLTCRSLVEGRRLGSVCVGAELSQIVTRLRRLIDVRDKHFWHFSCSSGTSSPSPVGTAAHPSHVAIPVSVAVTVSPVRGRRRTGAGQGPKKTHRKYSKKIQRRSGARGR